MRPARVLIVDDNSINVELTELLLEQAGFAHATAVDANDALARIPVFAPDLILMDIQMPGMDGLALTRRLKADPATRHIVIVAFTAYAMKGDELKMLTAGCDGYLSKPIDVDSFGRHIRAYLEPPA